MSKASSIRKGKTQYSEKLQPEERQQQKLASVNLDSSSSGDEQSGNQSNKLETDANDSEWKQTEEIKADHFNNNNKKRKRIQRQDAAQEAHTKMYERAMGFID